MSDTLEQLEERVRSGDETVTPEEVEQARVMGRFAELRKVAADRRAQAAAEAAAEERRTAALAEAERLLAQYPEEAREARVRDVQRAVAALRAELDGYHEAAARAWAVMSAGRPVPMTTFDPVTPMQYQRRPGLGWGYANGSPAVYRDGVNVMRLDVDAVMRRALAQREEG